MSADESPPPETAEHAVQMSSSVVPAGMKNYYNHKDVPTDSLITNVLPGHRHNQVRVVWQRFDTEEPQQAEKAGEVEETSEDSVPDDIEEYPLDYLDGIGSKLFGKYRQEDIRTIGDLMDEPVETLQEAHGVGPATAESIVKKNGEVFG